MALPYALGSFDDDQVVALLLEGLRSDDDVVREACEESLERIRKYREQVERCRGETRATPIREAARGLGTLGAPEALLDLIRALKDADAAVRAAAQTAIHRLSTASSGG